MPRIIEAFKQFLDDNGDPLINGKLKFVVSGTNNTDKDTFADINESIKNANPVILGGDGRCPNVFGAGSYNVISYTSDNVQVQQFDPVGGEREDAALDAWDAITIYASGAIVTGSDGLYYRSIISANENQDPTTSPDKWEEIKFVPVWNTNIDYSAGDSVYGSDGFIYTSRTSSNTGNNPTTDTTNWRPGINEVDLKGADIASANDTILLDDGNINDITGAVTINGLTTPSYGNPVRRFHLDGAPLLKHDTAPSAGFSKLFIVGGAVDYQASVSDEFVAYYDGTYWRVLIEKADGKALVSTSVFTESFTSAEQTITAAGALTLAHSLSASPSLVQARLICKTAEGGYSIGDEVIINPAGNDIASAANRGIMLRPDATNMNIRYGADASPTAIIHNTTGGAFLITPANWKLIVRAWV